MKLTEAQRRTNIVRKIFAADGPMNFIANSGPKFTWDIANRFGWYSRDALQHMKELEKRGLVAKHREIAYGGGSTVGAGWVWELTPAGRAALEQDKK